jgi:hypothetical protein
MRILRNRTTAAIAIVAAGTLAVAACGTRDLSDTRAQALSGGAAPMSVVCEPTQRAIVRPVVVNGTSMSQVECVSTGLTPVAYQPGLGLQPGAMPANYTQPVYGYATSDTARVVPVSYSAARTVEPRRIVTSRAPVRYERSGRSVKKSALIIGGSAGAGAGIGAAIGGKKGALIGALLGGGGATVWDQVTRRK